MSRDEAINALEQSSEGKVPWRYLPDFLDYLSITESELFANLDRFTNKRLFETDEQGDLIKDNEGNLIAKFKPFTIEAVAA